MAFIHPSWTSFLYSPSPSDNIPSPSSTSTPASSSIYNLFHPRPAKESSTVIMNLRIVPAVPSAPTVIFSLNWHNLPSSLPIPSFFANQIAACQDANVPAPRNTLALDKAVGFHLLLESVTFDLARGVVAVAWLDKRTQEWAIESTEGLNAALEDVLECVRSSGDEADKEKKAAAAASAQAKAQAAAGHSHSASVTSTPADAISSSNASLGHKRHRTASGIFSSLVASFIAPPISPDPNVPAHLAHLYRSRRSNSSSSSKSTTVPLLHRQHVFHPLNKRESFPSNAVPQSRFLRRQARAKLVDVFRFYVAGRLVNEMRAAGIVGEELRERGILDDMDDSESEETGSLPGTSGYAAAGGYVAYMARSLLRSALAEAKSDDSLSSSSEDSLLLTPPNNSDTSLPSSDASSSKATAAAAAAPKAVSTPSSPRRRAPTPSPQARQIRHLSSLLIGLTQKDKRSSSEEREMLELVKERSLRRRWSLTDASARVRCASDPQEWTKPAVPSPLRSSEIATYDNEEEDEVVVPRSTVSIPIDLPSVPFPSDLASQAVAFPNSSATPLSPPPVPRRTRSLPAPPPTALEEEIVGGDIVMEDAKDQTASVPKAAEAEDAIPSRPRCSSILTSAPSTPSSSPSIPRPPLSSIQTHNAPEDSDLIAIRTLPSLPSPKYTEFDENVSQFARQQQQFPQDVSDDEDDESVEDSDEDSDAASRVSPPPMYAPTLPAMTPANSEHSFRGDIKHAVLEVRGLELDTEPQQKQVTPYWPHPDGIYVV